MMGEILVNQGAINLRQLDQALDLQRNNAGRLGDIIVELGFMTQQDIDKVLEASNEK